MYNDVYLFMVVSIIVLSFCCTLYWIIIFSTNYKTKYSSIDEDLFYDKINI